MRVSRAASGVLLAHVVLCSQVSSAQTPVDTGMSSRISVIRSEPSTLSRQPLYLIVGAKGCELYRSLVAGKEVVTPSPLLKLDPSAIERVGVVRHPEARSRFGSDEENGVVIITLKTDAAPGLACPPESTRRKASRRPPPAPVPSEGTACALSAKVSLDTIVLEDITYGMNVGDSVRPNSLIRGTPLDAHGKLLTNYRTAYRLVEGPVVEMREGYLYGTAPGTGTLLLCLVTTDRDSVVRPAHAVTRMHVVVK
jgi:hypothetical protein